MTVVYFFVVWLMFIKLNSCFSQKKTSVTTLQINHSCDLLRKIHQKLKIIKKCYTEIAQDSNKLLQSCKRFELKILVKHMFKMTIWQIYLIALL